MHSCRIIAAAQTRAIESNDGKSSYVDHRSVEALVAKLPPWRSHITAVNIDSIAVFYQEGKPWEEEKQLCLKSLGFLDRITSRINQERHMQDVQDDVNLLLTFTDFQSGVLRFGQDLANLKAASDAKTKLGSSVFLIPLRRPPADVPDGCVAL